MGCDGFADDITILTSMLTIGKKVFREGHWHGKGGDGDAEAVYDRLSYSWNDLGNIY